MPGVKLHTILLIMSSNAVRSPGEAFVSIQAREDKWGAIKGSDKKAARRLLLGKIVGAGLIAGRCDDGWLPCLHFSR